jgi:hypothetical protein
MEKGSLGREIGSNKPKLTDKEKEEVQKRMRLENYLKKLAKGDDKNIGLAKQFL